MKITSLITHQIVRSWNSSLFAFSFDSSNLIQHGDALAVTRLVTEPFKPVTKASQWYSICFSAEVFKRHHPLQGGY